MKFYNLSPLGLGTQEAESFDSYLLRLAAAHGVTVRILLMTMSEYRYYEEVRQHKSIRIKGNRGKCVYSGYVPESYVTPGGHTQNTVELVSFCTGRSDLSCMTFLALQRIRYRSVNLMGHFEKWCPCCWQDDKDKGRPIYYRLLWTLAETSYCPIHNVQMASECPSCGAWQKSLKLRFDLESCISCGQSIIGEPEPCDSLALFQDVCFRDLIALVCEVSSDPNLVYKTLACTDLLEKIFDQAWQVEAEKTYLRKFLDEELIGQVRRREALTFRNLRRLAHCLGISFPGLLAGEDDCWIPQLDPTWIVNFPSNLQVKKRRKLVDRDELQQNISALRNSIDPNSPPSLASFARVLGISTGGLEYLHPTVCAEIKHNYKEWLIIKSERKRTESLKAVYEYLESNVVNKSRKHALKTIRARTNLPKNVLMEIIGEEFAKIGYGSDSVVQGLHVLE